MKMSDVLDCESHWFQYASAGDAQEKSVPVNSDDACKFCLLGAAIRVAQSYPEEMIDVALEELQWELKKAIEQIAPKFHALTWNPSRIVTTFNDEQSRTFKDIQAVLGIVESGKIYRVLDAMEKEILG